MKVTGKLLSGIALLAIAASACTSDDPTPTPIPSPTAVAAATFEVTVGAEDLAQAISLEAFLPKDVTINAGDTLVFHKKTAEAHTVTFNLPDPAPEDFLPTADGQGLEANPVVFFASPAQPPAAPGEAVNFKFSFDGSGYLNSGFLPGVDDKVSVTFSKAGAYDYICKLHPAMKGKVTVQAIGAARSTTQLSLETAATAERNQLFTLSQSLLAATKPAGVSGTTHHVLAGAGDGANGVDFYRFLGGENLTVNVGDGVDFSLGSNVPGTPHTITFLSGGAIPELITAVLRPDGPPQLLVNPEVLVPAPLPPTGEYDGTGYLNSGLLVTGGPMPQNFMVTFTKAGTYKYLCVLHDPAGMNGTITVH